MSINTIRVNATDLPARSVLEFDPPANYRDDPENDRIQVTIPVPPIVHVSEPSVANQAISYAPAVAYIDGPAASVRVTLPPAQLHGGQRITLIDLGDAPREIVLCAAVGEIDYIDDVDSELSLNWTGVRIELVGFVGSLERRSGWHIVSIRERGT